MVRYILFKVKKGKLDTLKKWGIYLQKHKKEVLQALKYERVNYETLQLFKTKGEWYVLGVMECQKNFRPADMKDPLNAKHFAVLKKCLQKVDLSALYEFK